MLVPFVGRQAELRQMAKLLADRDCRLLTLVGPGGSGKTRLAMRAAADNVPDWPDGVWLVALDDPSAGTDLETALVNALGIPITDSAQTTRFQIYDFLCEKELLLVLDNFERMIKQADLVKSLLYHVPKLKVIATSRQWLGIQGEQVMPMGGLDFPTDDDFVSLSEEELAQWAQGYSAVHLFVENARRVEPRFELSPQNVGDIVRICQLVDGLPLAIEMASAWVRIFPCDQILARIEQNVDFLTSRTKDGPQRQASFRESFEYSWKLLSEEEREMLLKVAVFRGSFSTEAAQEVARASLHDLVSLKDRFLLRQFPGNRFDVQPLLVQYVTQRASLHRDLAQEVRERHSTYYLAFLTERASTLTAEEIRQDLENIRAARQWAAENDRLAELQPSLDALARFPELTNLSR
jgi:predicted ATPase